MFWNRKSEAEPVPEGPGMTENIRALLASASGYLRARMELAGLEGKEAIGIYGGLIALAIGAVALLIFGYIFFWIGVIALVPYWLGIHWGWGALIVALLHFVGTATLLALAYRKWGEPVFTATLEEFRKDQQWLSRTTSPAPSRRHV